MIFKKAKQNTLTAIKHGLVMARMPVMKWGFGTYHALPLATIGEKTRELTNDLGGRWEVPQGQWVPQDLRDWLPNHLITQSGHDTSARFTPGDLEGLAVSPASVVIYHFGLAMAAATSALILTFSDNSLGYLIGTAGLAALVYSPLHATFGGSARKAILIALAGLGVAGLSFGTLGAKAMLGFMATGTPVPELNALAGNQPFSWLTFSLVNLAIFAPLIYVLKDNKLHLKQLLEQAKHYGGAQSIKRFLGKDKRQQQAVRATKDREAGALFIPFAYSLGAFQDVISPSICDPGLIIGLSSKDTNLHVYTTGATGKGKTGFLRHVIFTVSRSMKFGLLVACGKGELAGEVAKALDYEITPENPYNAFHGLTPLDIEQSLRARHSTSSDKNKVFTEGALQFIRACLNLLHACLFNDLYQQERLILEGVEIHWNPMGLITMSQLLQEGKVNQELAETIRHLHYEKTLQPGPLKSSLDYVLKEFPAIPKDTLQSFLANVNQWLGEFTAEPSMAHWASATNPPAAFEECYTNAKKIGIGFGDKQGVTGSLYLHFVNRRFKQITKLYGPNRKNDCFYVFDECYALLTLNSAVPSFLDDDIFLAQGRSYGVHCFYANQSDAQLHGLHPAKVVDGFLGNFNSGVDLGSDDSTTAERLVQRAGHAPRFGRNNVPAETIDFLSTYANKANAPVYDLTNQFRNGMRGFLGFFGIKADYKGTEGKIDNHPIITRTVMGTKDPIPVLDKNTFSSFSVMPQVGFMYLQRAGLRRVDYGHMIGADQDGNPYPLSDLLAEIDDIEQQEAIKKAHQISDLLSAGKTIEAAAIAQAEGKQ